MAQQYEASYAYQQQQGGAGASDATGTANAR